MQNPPLDTREGSAVETLPDVRLLRTALELVEPQLHRVGELFYARLFTERPELRELFPLAMDVQRSRLLRALVRIVTEIDRVTDLAPYLAQLGRDHRKFDARPEHYEAVGRALVGAIAAYTDDRWTPELEEAWWAAYRYAARVMVAAAEQAGDAPAYWHGEVVAHERRSRDIAVLRVRPDRPYPYRAGQYATVETPRRPRLWRAYSMADAPRPDGLLEFHVKAVGAGWVSNTLVWRTVPGDVLRVGPPLGSMTAARTTGRDVLAVAGSTGLAPLRAIIADLSRRDELRRIHLFFGARTQDELYDGAALEELRRRNPLLSVHVAVSHDPAYRGERGMISDVVARYGSWSSHDVFVCGSPEMVGATLHRLSDLQVPPERIAYDAFETG